jgi:hypothetical protein
MPQSRWLKISNGVPLSPGFPTLVITEAEERLTSQPLLSHEIAARKRGREARAAAGL